MNGSARLLVTALVATAILGVGLPAAAEEPTIPESTSFGIVGAVRTPRMYTLGDLQREPATNEAVHFNTGKGPVSGTFTGVQLWALLQEVGIATDPAVKNDILRHTVTVTGTDGYRVVLSAGELDPEFGGELAIVAFARDGQLLGANGGFARLIVPGDKGGGRKVASITEIEVR